MNFHFKKIFVEISGCCNLKCEFCPAATTAARPFMSPQLFEKILKQTKDLTERHCLHVLGEPLLHPQFEELLTIAQKVGVKLEITSNGLLIKQHLPILSINQTIAQLNISLHSLNSNLGILKTLAYLKELLPSLEVLLDQSPNLFINLRFWRSSEQDQQLLSDILSLYEGKNFLKKDKNLRLRPRLLIHFEQTFNWPDLTQPILHMHGKCHALSSHFGILADGTIIPCCLDSQGDISLGNINNQNVLEILNSTKAQNMLKGFQKKELKEELCQRCQYIERFSTK